MWRKKMVVGNFHVEIASIFYTIKVQKKKKMQVFMYLFNVVQFNMLCFKNICH